MKKIDYNFEVGGKVFQSGTHIMGILNVTPDSFYPPSRVLDDVVIKAHEMLKNGAEILDIGGQSTRPNAKKVGVLEELSRILPAVCAIKSELNAIVSVDTFYPEVARQALFAGANMINDVTCLKYDGMAEMIADANASVCIMHDRRGSNIQDLFVDKSIGFRNAITKAKKAGIDCNKILLDGGIGFNLSNIEDWELLRGYHNLIEDFQEYPFLLGTSRKSMFGGDMSSRLSATLDSTMLAVAQGVLFVRVHDIAENFQVIKSLS